MLRNAPPVAGAIHWSRQLLKRIEDPMKVFRDNKAVSSLKDFSRIVRYSTLTIVQVLMAGSPHYTSNSMFISFQHQIGMLSFSD